MCSGKQKRSVFARTTVLSSPALVEPGEEVAVKRPQVREVAFADERIGSELQAAEIRKAGLEPLKLVAVADATHIAQDIGAGVDVGVVAHTRRDAPFAAAEASKSSSGSSARRRRSASRRSASEASPRTQRSASSRTAPVGSRPSRRSEPATLAAI
jgi:hypothetical protein